MSASIVKFGPAIKLEGTPSSVGEMQSPLLSHACGIVRAALASGYAYESADGFARRIGLRDRHQLNRSLRRAGFPCYRSLAAFARVLALMDEASVQHRSLYAVVIAAGYEPAWAYRTIRRTTGQRWSDVRRLSHADLVALLFRAMGPPADMFVAGGPTVL